MGTMTTCTGSLNEPPSSKEIKFTLLGGNSSSTRENKNKKKIKSRSNSQIYSIIKEEEFKNDFGIFKFEESKNQIYQIPKCRNKKNFINKKENNLDNIFNYKEKIKGFNSGLKQIQIDKTEDDCDIIECEDDFECENLIDLIKNVDINNNKRKNYFSEKNNNIRNNNNIKNNNKNNIKIYNNKEYSKSNSIEKEKVKEKEIISNNELLNDSYINKDLNMELSISKNKINSSDIQGSTIFENLANNEKSIEKNNDFDNSKDDKDNQINNIKKNDNIIDNIDKIEINCYNNKNLNLFNKNEMNNNHKFKKRY